MKRTFVLAPLLLAGCLWNLTGLDQYSDPPPYSGVLYSKIHYSIPRRTPLIIGTGNVLKHGETCTVSFLWLSYYVYDTGGSVLEAAKKGGITKIASVDHFFTSFFFGIYYKDCTRVWGE